MQSQMYGQPAYDSTYNQGYNPTYDQGYNASSNGMGQQPAYQPNNQFVMPGVAVQPNYINVNPYAGNHNYQPVPVVYDPAMYGVQYETAPGPYKQNQNPTHDSTQPLYVPQNQSISGQGYYEDDVNRATNMNDNTIKPIME